MAEHASIQDVFERIVSVEEKVTEFAGDMIEVREDINDLSDRITDIEQWRKGRDGVIRTEIEAYHKSPEYQLVMAATVVPAMKAAARAAVSWKRILAAMGALALFLNVINAAFIMIRNLT